MKKFICNLIKAITFGKVCLGFCKKPVAGQYEISNTIGGGAL
jgi:hypothetical protein